MNSIIVLIIVVVLGLLCAGAAVLLLRYRKARRHRGLQLLQAFRMLIKHIQIHRGLMAAYLSGENEVVDSIAFTADSVMSDIKNISLLAEKFVDDENWLGVTQHWAKLSSASRRLGIFENYNQHCNLIAACLALMIEVHGRYRIVGHLAMKERIHWYELLTLGESLGQLRALGVIYLGHVKDLGLKEKCIVQIGKSVTAVDALLKDRSLRLRIGSLSYEEINTFLALVEHYLVENKSWITGEQYFSRATETIELVYHKFDDEMQKLLR